MKDEHKKRFSGARPEASLRRPVRVLRVIARLNIGGPARHVGVLSAGLNREGYRHLLVTGREAASEGSLRSLAEGEGVEVADLPRLGREISPVNDLLCVGNLGAIIRNFQPDIVHTHTAKAGFVGRVAALRAGVPVLAHTFHGHVLRGYFSPWKNLVFRRLEQWLARHTGLLITVSQTVAEELSAEGVAPRSRFEIVPLGLVLRPFLEVGASPDLKRELGLAAGVRLLGAVGRLVPIKDLPTLLEALALLQSEVPDLHLALVGDGESAPDLRQLARRKGIGDRVHFAGWRGDLRSVYAGLDAVVLSSRNEGTPVSLIEALAAGRPVVATTVGGVPEVLEQGRLGRLVPAGRPDRLAQAIREALQDPRPPSRSDREAVVDRFSPEKLVQRMDRLYRQLLARRGSDGLE